MPGDTYFSGSTRVSTQTYQHDWPGNTTSTGDDQGAFYDRSLGQIQNGGAGHVEISEKGFMDKRGELVSADEMVEAGLCLGAIKRQHQTDLPALVQATVAAISPIPGAETSAFVNYLSIAECGVLIARPPADAWRSSAVLAVLYAKMVALSLARLLEPDRRTEIWTTCHHATGAAGDLIQ